MNESLLLNKQIHDICHETVNIKMKKVKPQVVLKNIVTFFHKHLLGSKNVYLAMFVSKKMQALSDRWDDDLVHRKLLVEVFVFMAVCNRPTKENDNTGAGGKGVSAGEAEQLLVEEMRARRSESVVLRCVPPLIKEHEETLWNVVESNSSGKLRQYVNAMRHMHSVLAKKEFMLEAFKSVCNNQAAFFFDTKDYSPIIFQCMLKINYIYETRNMHDKQMDVYLSCLNCPMDLLHADDEAQRKKRANLIAMLSDDDTNAESVTRSVSIVTPTIKKLRDII